MIPSMFRSISILQKSTDNIEVPSLCAPNTNRCHSSGDSKMETSLSTRTSRLQFSAFPLMLSIPPLDMDVPRTERRGCPCDSVISETVFCPFELFAGSDLKEEDSRILSKTWHPLPSSSFFLALLMLRVLESGSLPLLKMASHPPFSLNGFEMMPCHSWSFSIATWQAIRPS